jgi:Glycosyl hydrolases family 28
MAAFAARRLISPCKGTGSAFKRQVARWPVSVHEVSMLRRDFLIASQKVAGFASLAGIGLCPSLLRSQPGAPPQGAKNILDYGAKPNGKSLSTNAIQRAIDDASAGGGGVVLAPAGKFLIAGLELKSRVTLYLDAGCTLLGSAAIEDYPDSDHRHVLLAKNAEDLTLSGQGTIDGQGPAFWERSDRPPTTPDNAWKDVATHSTQVRKGGRPSPMVQFEQCRNVHISGITLSNSSGRTLQSLACDTVTIDGMRIRNAPFGINTDGIDIVASRNVSVSNCDIATGDDAICLKSPSPYGDTLPTENITVSNCRLTSSCNGFKIGTETHGVFRNIRFTDSAVYSDPAGPINQRVIGGVSIEVADGGSVEDVVVSGIRMRYVRAPIFVRLEQRSSGDNSFLRNVHMDGIEAEGAIVTSSITGVPSLRPSGITLSNSHIHTVEAGRADWAGREIPEASDKYPEAWMMGRLPAYGFYIRHADQVELRDVTCIADQRDERPAIVCNDVQDATFAGLSLSGPASGAPVFDLRDAQRVLISGTQAPAGSKVLAQVSGGNSSGIRLTADTLMPGQQAISLASGAPPDAVTVE